MRHAQHLTALAQAAGGLLADARHRHPGAGERMHAAERDLMATLAAPLPPSAEVMREAAHRLARAEDEWRRLHPLAALVGALARLGPPTA